MDEPIRIVICTRHTLLRQGIKAMLDHEGPIQVAGEAATATDAAAVLKRVHSDVILMDPTDPDLSGSEATRLVKSACPQVKVLLLALDADASMIAECVRAGASGYIGNSDKPAQLKVAIKGLCGREVRVHAA
jgi:two-component system, NarL family, nitrate/nitrite response regulator NarL